MNKESFSAEQQADLESKGFVWNEQENRYERSEEGQPTQCIKPAEEEGNFHVGTYTGEEAPAYQETNFSLEEAIAELSPVAASQDEVQD